MTCDVIACLEELVDEESILSGSLPTMVTVFLPAMPDQQIHEHCEGTSGNTVNCQQNCILECCTCTQIMQCCPTLPSCYAHVEEVAMHMLERLAI